ncbi:hypothetical protein [Allosphingosinicella flava]|nr:hypothetical protein [Sphingosinicella flava]
MMRRDQYNIRRLSRFSYDKLTRRERVILALALHREGQRNQQEAA